MSPLPLDETSNSPGAADLATLRAPLSQLPSLSHNFTSVFHTLASTSSSQFLPTPITALPHGQETGRFLALDLGGTNLRVCIVELLGASGAQDGARFRILPQGNWPIPGWLKTGAAELLFKWVAQRIVGVIEGFLASLSAQEAGDVIENGIEMGVTFSFPMEQTTHNSAIIMPMGKGFTFLGTNNLAALLTGGYSNLTKTYPTRLPPLQIVAITNDSIATLLAAAYTHNTSSARTAVGIIAGTGTNATCLVPVSHLAPEKQQHAPATASHVLTNTEWSINGTLPPLKPYVTSWDETIAAKSEKPGFQPFEEMVGGRYLGEIVRLAALDSLVFQGKPPLRMRTPFGVDTALLSAIEAAPSLVDVQELLVEYFAELPATGAPSGEGQPWSLDKAEKIRELTLAVSERAAALVAASTIGLLGISGEMGALEEGQELLVGYTGTVLEKYHRFLERVEGFINQLTGNGSVRLVEAKDGGVVGAAVLAAMVKAGAT